MTPSIKEYRWILADPPDQTIVDRIARDLNVPAPIARLLVHRGIHTYEQAREYFRPTLAQLHDPFLMDGMDAAVDRLLRLLDHNERLLVFGDYDVDGTNGAAMLSLFFRDLGADVSYYIPDRLKEGYGISRQGIDRAVEQGVKVFLAVDCGITAVEQVEYAVSRGLDVIICDHHEPGPALPPAVAVLDPLKPGDRYPFKSLCGCGVGFKLLQAVAIRLGRQDRIVSSLDFVALASTADIVPLTGENRVLTRLGLEQLNADPRPGIRALMEEAGLKPGKINTGNIVFVLGPRMNAAGRLGDATRAVRLLTSTDPAEAVELARELEEENKNRRKIDEETFACARELAENLLDMDTDPAIVLHQNDWHPGVVGIVASRMVERYYKPSIMMATIDGVAKGSARSVSGFDIYEALRRCEDKLIQFGGHKYAAGLTVEISRVEEFREAFNAVVRELMTEEQKTPVLRVDTEISFADISPRFLRILKEFGPFGPSNMKPTFVARDIEIVGSPRIVGKNHLRFRARQNGKLLDAIGFGLGDLLQRLDGNRRGLSAVFNLEEDDYNASSRQGDGMPQMRIKDLRTPDS